MKNVDNQTVQQLLAYYLEYTYDKVYLASVDQIGFDSLTKALQEQFDDIELTKDDIRAAWFNWFDNAAHDGTLIYPQMSFAGKQSWSHPELDIIDKLLDLAKTSIYSLR